MPDDPDPRVGLIITAFQEIIRSVPTARDPAEHGPLTEDEICQATELMDELGEQIKAERKNPPAG
jgi:hypothetical protein